MRAVAMTRIQHDVFILVYDVDNMKPNAELFRRMQGTVAQDAPLPVLAHGMGVSLDAKAGKKVDTFDVDPLIQYQPGREHRIQTARKQDNCLSLTVFHKTLGSPPFSVYSWARLGARPQYIAAEAMLTRPRPMRLFRLLLAAVLVTAVVDIGVLGRRWFSMPRLTSGPVPKSRFILAYLRHRSARHWPPLRWQPVPLATIPPALRAAAILGEDGTFYENDGFDPRSILWAARYDWRARRIVFGASTITQQTAKNLFLNPSRSFFRKGNEALLTIALDHFLTKNRVLEIYLDDAEFGRGVYGVAAASRYYFGKPVGSITVHEAAELAATLPDPDGSNPATQSPYFRARTAKLMRLLAWAGYLPGPRAVDGKPPRGVANALDGAGPSDKRKTRALTGPRQRPSIAEGPPHAL